MCSDICRRGVAAARSTSTSRHSRPTRCCTTDTRGTSLAGGAGCNTRRYSRCAHRGRNLARPRELRVRACGRARCGARAAVAIVRRCDPRVRSAGPVGTVARVRRASGIPVRSAQCPICAPIARPFGSAGRIGRGRPRRANIIFTSSMPRRRCSPPPNHGVRARSITPPTVAPSRSCSSWMRSRAASAGRSRCTCRRTQPLARLIIRKEHMQQTALAMPLRAPSPRVPGWKPKFADYRKGLDQVIEAWRDKSSPPVHK